MTDIIDRLKEPEAHYPGNFDTPKRANAMLSCLCQEAMEEIESLRRELAEARQEIADRKADCETGHDQDEATIAELRQQLKHMTDEYHAALEAEQVRYRQVVEKDAEIARLNSKLHSQALDCIAADGQAFDSWQQLAAIQAYAQQLREALNQGYGWAPIGSTSKQIMGLALALPQDTTALEAMIAKAGEVMWERCAVECETHYNFSNALAAAIRALPGVTLEDIK